MKRWHIIKTKPGKESQVTTLFGNAGFEIFNPYFKEISYKKSLKTLIARPLFPTYLFLNINFEEKDNLHLVRYTRGVSKILCANNIPLPVDSQIIDTIRSRCDEHGVIHRNFKYQKGEQVRVKKGVLKDLIGILEKPTSDEERIIVLFKLANAKLKATLHWTEVEKVKAA